MCVSLCPCFVCMYIHTSVSVFTMSYASIVAQVRIRCRHHRVGPVLVRENNQPQAAMTASWPLAATQSVQRTSRPLAALAVTLATGTAEGRRTRSRSKGAHPDDAHSVMLSSVSGMTTMTIGRTIQMGPFSACLGRRLYRFVGQWL